MRLNTAALMAFLLIGTGAMPRTGHALPTVLQDGSSITNAIPIRAPNEQTGVKAEYHWIAEHFPGYKRGGQALLNQNGRVYDSIEIITASGERRKVFFDITDFFGKM
ncbi:hypothetical protein [Dyella mobilis]|uniref:Adenosylhomocysteinase n=1 Tax=Dyella mobilis TaxID=1849582 RepID=A0ABS2KJ50_9GAMM|nr:hypothetical protein [Dyella mobilis]MBM7131208.1 adenosylhomocysteinase [Dyella mobilis]GLQ98857.1 hypothetical protein GCM10007863_32770 [Dyella mobilis]